MLYRVEKRKKVASVWDEDSHKISLKRCTKSGTGLFCYCFLDTGVLVVVVTTVVRIVSMYIPWRKYNNRKTAMPLNLFAWNEFFCFHCFRCNILKNCIFFSTSSIVIYMFVPYIGLIRWVIGIYENECIAITFMISLATNKPYMHTIVLLQNYLPVLQ